MNIKQIITVGIAGVALGAMALDKVEVTGVTARQRYPWNGLVDIDFTTDSTPTEPYQMKVVAFDNVGKTNLPVKTIYTEGVSFKENPCMVRTDTRRILWDASADLPNGFKATNVLVSCQDVRVNPATNTYMIVDLSGGTTAASFPVSYTNAPPPEGWTEECKLSKLVFRRLEQGSFLMGSSPSEDGHVENEVLHKVTLTHPFYISVFELTSCQYSLICGGSGTTTQPVALTWDKIRGFDTSTSCVTNSQYIEGNQYGGYKQTATITQVSLGNNYAWPQSLDVDKSSLVGKLRNHTGLQFDLPSEAQWEYACRSGTDRPVNIGVDNTESNRNLVSGSAKYDATGDHLIYVGNYMPNASGLYDMAGGLGEWCLDGYVEDLGNENVTDPSHGITLFKKYDLGTQQVTFWGSGIGYVKLISPFCMYPNWQDFTDSYLSYTGYASCHVVRGADTRSASRTFLHSLNTTVPIFNIKWSRSEPNYAQARNVGTYVFSFNNPTAGVRLALTINE